MKTVYIIALLLALLAMSMAQTTGEATTTGDATTTGEDTTTGDLSTTGDLGNSTESENGTLGEEATTTGLSSIADIDSKPIAITWVMISVFGVILVVIGLLIGLCSSKPEITSYNALGLQERGGLVSQSSSLYRRR